MPTALGGVACPCTFDENLSYQASRDAEKVGPISGSRGATTQSKPRFMDKSGRVQRLSWAFPAHLRVRNPSQLFVHERQERIERSLVAVTCCGQQFGHGRLCPVGHL